MVPPQKKEKKEKKKKEICPTSSENKVIPMKTEKYLSLVRNIHALFEETMTRREISTQMIKET
jgi:hypothetical protein